MEDDSINKVPQIKEMLLAMKDQWQSMLGMALMFVVTILIGIIIQPFYDKPEFRAFGEAGASQARNVIFEFIMILVFTAAIIFLAKRKKDWIIKYGILGILFIALCYATIPLTNLVITSSVEPLEFENIETPYEIITQHNDGFYSSQKLINKTTGEIGAYAFYKFSNAYDGSGTGPLEMTHEGVVMYTNNELFTYSSFSNGIIICDDSQLLKLHKNFNVNNDLISDIDCKIGFSSNNSEWYISSENKLNKIGEEGSFEIPEFIKNETLINVWSTSNEKLIWVTENRIAVLNLPTDIENFTIQYESIHTEKITSASLGTSLWQDSNEEQQLLVIGDYQGNVLSWNINNESNLTKENRMHLDDGYFLGPIKSVLLANYNGVYQDELFVLDSNNLRMFRSSSLREEINLTSDTLVNTKMVLSNSSDDSVDSIIFLQNENGWRFLEISEEQLELVNPWAGLIGFCISTILMIFLYIRPEWYVVNLVGILVGAGVVAMLGISFVPWLIIIFMIIAAVYDAWAVYKSKHMLDLADTMVNLKLPILLVAPQEKNYSFLEEKNTMRDRENLENNINENKFDKFDEIQTKKKKDSSRDAMFMGLGDVIFPGILVISAITWLPEGTLILGIDATLWIGIITMIGGLCGYFVLMGFVALGKPQAGLPLLNSGSILGYLISTIMFLGISALEFNISL
ncbi:MAG: hypothetical protein CMB64_02305 [Euryarchaeota archaeon]|nr:hypothetical protein [Euryarchaeota archaeon]